MANVALLWPDYLQPTITNIPVFMDVGSWLSALPLNNLQSLDFSKVARSTDVLATSTKVLVDLGQPRMVGMIAIGRHNASPAGVIHVTTSLSSNLASPVHSVISSPLWPSGKTVEEMDGYNVNWFTVLVPGSARYVLLEVSDPDNPAGYFEAAGLKIGGLFQPEINLDYGVSLGWEDPTIADVSPDRVSFYDVKQPQRVKRFSLSNLTESEAFEMVFEMHRRLGIHGTTFVSFNPESTGLRRWQQSFLCTMRTLNAIEHPYFNNHGAAFELAEVLSGGGASGVYLVPEIVDGGNAYGV